MTTETERGEGGGAIGAEALPLPAFGRVVIWLLSLLIYGGGLAGWWVWAQRLPPQSTWRPFESEPTAEMHLPANLFDEAEPPGDFVETKASVVEQPPPPVAARVVPAPLVRKSPAPAEWPRIHVLGGVHKAGVASALLDGAVVPLGGAYEGVVVMTVEADRVELAFGGERRWIPLGGYTR